MSGAKYDVVGLGNAIVDVLAPCDDAFLARHGIAKDAMNLIEEPRAEELTRLALNPVITSGGSGANTIAGLASFGASAGYIGKIADDELGHQFMREMMATGVPFHTRPVTSWNGRVAISCPASATPMMMDWPQPRWQHSSAWRITVVLPVQSKE